MTELVSILIPAYNAERWLGATIESALAQTWPAKEIIVVDDGSTDRTLAVARGFGDRGVQVITQANRGAAAARNTALRAARGAWIQFLDADDLLNPRKIEQPELRESLQVHRNPADLHGTRGLRAQDLLACPLGETVGQHLHIQRPMRAVAFRKRAQRRGQRHGVAFVASEHDRATLRHGDERCHWARSVR